ncbi:MAG: alpha/beta hydrolase [Eubacterium sp.]|nr:alpha/beta hydrolase [Eubacterium sp.]
MDQETVNRESFQFLSKDGRTKIHAVKWLPKDGIVRAVLQITHGMVEYIERYEELACYMAGRGFLVAGHDHLGHGASVTNESEWGYFAEKRPSETVVADIYQLTTIIKNQYPGCPYFILGHSMGSFLLRRYLTIHSGAVDGALLCGTGSQPKIATFLGMAVCRLMGLLHGGHYRSAFVTGLCFGKPYAEFDKTGEDIKRSWLSKNRDSVQAYYEDPRCTFVFTLNGYYGLFSTIHYVSQMKQIRKIRKNLPVLFLAGEDDPVGDFGKGVKKAYAQYRQAGIRDVKMKLYSNDRHEILQETDRKQVFKDVYEWCEKHGTNTERGVL